jgi:hypothetical protein
MMWYDDPGNLIVFGRSQTGKTTAVREIHAKNNRLSIWLNEPGKHRVENVSGKRVRGLRAIESGMAEDTYKFNYIASDRASDIQELQEWAWRKAEKSGRRLPMQIVVDEIQRVAPQSNKHDLPGRDEIRVLLKEGMKRNVKFVGITQDPVSMDRQSRSQREYLLLFPLAKEQRDTITDYVDDIDRVNAQPEYSGVLYHADGHVVEEGVKARAKYG